MRVIPWEAFKDKKAAQELSDAINELVGTDKAFVTDKAVTSVSLCEKLNFFKHRPVKYRCPLGQKDLLQQTTQRVNLSQNPIQLLKFWAQRYTMILESRALRYSQE